MSYPKVMTEAATVAAATAFGHQAGRSLARFGDGELKLALGADCKSQAHDPGLAKALRAVLRDTAGPCLPCIPRMDFGSPKAAFWSRYKSARYTGLYNPAAVYGSAFVTRPDSAPEIDAPGYWSGLQALWRDREVVLVRGSTKSLTAERLTGAASVHEIVGPRQHAWVEADTLAARVREAWAPRFTRYVRGDVTVRPVVILCLGATATVLAHRLAHEGVHALDLGHVGMFLRRLDPATGRTGLDYVKGDADE